MSRFRVGGYHHFSDNFLVQKVQRNSRDALSGAQIFGENRPRAVFAFLSGTNAESAICGSDAAGSLRGRRRAAAV